MTDQVATRYDPTLSSEPYQSHEYAVMEEDGAGEYVKHDEYELLKRHISELESRVMVLKNESAVMVEEFAEAECLGEVAKIARGYGYDEDDK